MISSLKFKKQLKLARQTVLFLNLVADFNKIYLAEFM